MRIPGSPDQPSARFDRLSLWIAVLLLLLTFLVYAQVGSFKFVYDDLLYVTKNSRTMAGLNWGSLRWAFTSFEDGGFLPLVWLSHAACVTAFGSNPAGHHYVNLALHLANTLILFLLLLRLTGDLYPSTVVAALFALHPVHVESVAWVSGRKDVLSTLFWLLTLWAYSRYVRNPGWRRYLGVTAFFLPGLLSKSMLVTLPLTMLLLDFWPLGRLEVGKGRLLSNCRALILEKVPFLLLAAAIGVVTLWTQNHAGAISVANALTVKVRAANALIAVLQYIRMFFWPSGLSPFYPHPGPNFSTTLVVAACLVILLVSALSFMQLRQRPYLIVGWLWFLVTLLPVLGFIQVGSQAYADRYTYVPLIGLFIMLAWGCADLLEHVRIPRVLVLALSGALLGTMTTLTAVQASSWRDTSSLFGYALTLDPNNEVAHACLGMAYGEEGNYPAAIKELAKAVVSSPNQPNYHLFLGTMLERNGQLDSALAGFKEAARLNPASVLADLRIAHLLVMQGKMAEALPYLDRGLSVERWRISPNPDVLNNALQVSFVDHGIILREQGRIPEAIQRIQWALEMNASNTWASLQLGISLLEAGQDREARTHLDRALSSDPENPTFHYHLGRGLLRRGAFDQASSHFEGILARNPQSVLGRRGMAELGQARRSGFRVPRR